MKNYILDGFNSVGLNRVNIELVVKDWNHLWFISKYHEEYSLIKAYSKRSRERTKLKTLISKDQAIELINKLSLKEYRSPIFTYGSTFRKE